MGRGQGQRKNAVGSTLTREAQVLSQLERHFYRLAEKSSLSVDRELSTQVVTALSPLLAKISPDPLELSVDIENFVINHERKLKHIFDSYADDDSAESLFLHQPESILDRKSVV